MLNAQGVEYLLVGGYAVSYHGYPRTTGDMDIWISMDSENADKVVAVLQEFGFAVPELSRDLFLRADQIVRMGTPPFRLEIFTTIPGVEFAECFSERVATQVDGVEVNLIDLEHLKVNKIASGRPKDIDDLQNLP